jgi:putative nucleotidyltransferase with HDIG domain
MTHPSSVAARIPGTSPRPFLSEVQASGTDAALQQFCDAIVIPIWKAGLVKRHILADTHSSGPALGSHRLRQAIDACDEVIFMADREGRRAERDLKRVNHLLRTLTAGNQVLVRSQTEQQLLEEMCQVVVRVGGYAMAAIALGDQNGSIRSVVSGGKDVESFLAELEASEQDAPGASPLSAVIRTGIPHSCDDIFGSTAASPWHDLAARHQIRSYLVLPLPEGPTTIGAFAIFDVETGAFPSEPTQILTDLSHDLAYGLTALRGRADRILSTGRLQRSLEATIAAIAAIAEMRDPYTAGHQRRVAELATAIAREMGLADSRVDAIRIAATLHDVGKIKIPVELLNKPGRASFVETQLIQTHVEAGYDILKGIDFPWPIAEIVLQHHERLDGSGYPHGLQADALRLESKILAVADVVEAMAADRPYRSAKGLDGALVEIEAGRGLLFDADTVDACVRLFRTKRFVFSPNIV